MNKEFKYATYCKLKAPCQGCNDRRLHCHNTCPEYIEFAKANEESRKAAHEILRNNDAIIQNHMKRNKSLAGHKTAGTKHKGFRRGFR